jgi:hypothetical protein
MSLNKVGKREKCRKNVGKDIKKYRQAVLQNM